MAWAALPAATGCEVQRRRDVDQPRRDLAAFGRQLPMSPSVAYQRSELDPTRSRFSPPRLRPVPQSPTHGERYDTDPIKHLQHQSGEASERKLRCRQVDSRRNAKEAFTKKPRQRSPFATPDACSCDENKAHLLRQFTESSTVCREPRDRFSEGHLGLSRCHTSTSRPFCESKRRCCRRRTHLRVRRWEPIRSPWGLVWDLFYSRDSGDDHLASLLS